LQFLLARDADLIETTSAEEQARLDKLVREKCDTSGQCDVIDFNGSLREYVGLPSIARRNVFFNFALPEGNVYAGSGQLDGQGVPLIFCRCPCAPRFNACFERSTFITERLAGDGQLPWRSRCYIMPVMRIRLPRFRSGAVRGRIPGRRVQDQRRSAVVGRRLCADHAVS
jgi:hypothetical protein